MFWVVAGEELRPNSRRMWEASLPVIFYAPTGTIETPSHLNLVPLQRLLCVPFGIPPLPAALHGPHSPPVGCW